MKSFAVLCLLAFAAVANGQGPVGWWKFDEAGGKTAFASAGTVNGALMGGSGFVPGGVSNNAISIPAAGEGDYALFGNHFGFETGDFTAIAWINTTDTSTNSTIILGKHHATVVAGWMLRLNQDVAGYGLAGKASFYVATPFTSNVPVSSITVTDGHWHQVVGVYSSGAASLYVDGQYQDARAATGPTNVTDAEFAVGGAYRGGGIYTNEYNGQVDDAQLYDRALSAGEIRQLYQNPGSALPEPASSLSLLLGIGGLLKGRRRMV